MVEIRNLTKKYGGKTALEQISLRFGPGEIVGLFGENGAGKTTLMKCIFGFIPCSGEVLLDGRPLDRSNIGRLSFATGEHSFFPNLTAAAHRDFYKNHFEHFREDRFDALMEFFGLPLYKKLQKFSLGQQNQFEVILALCQGAEYIFMDEPFVGNDVFNREDFYKVLLGILRPDETIVLSTHLIEEVSDFVDRAVLIRNGRIIGDKRRDVLDAEGLTLMKYIKTSYNYRAERVAMALSKLNGEERE